jgi:MerR family transcriptional regulator/heat shock protein HspR
MSVSHDEPCYTIGVTARLVELHPQTLRHYEDMGLIIPQRSDGNIRLYSQREIERLRKINRLTQDLGVNLAGVEIILRLSDEIETLRDEIACLERQINP